MYVQTGCTLHRDIYKKHKLIYGLNNIKVEIGKGSTLKNYSIG